MMKVDLTKIKTKLAPVVEFSFLEPLDALSYGYDSFTINGAVAVSGAITSRGADKSFVANIAYHAEAEVPCDRCGKATRLPAQGLIEAVFAPEAGAEPSGEITIYPLEGNAADLAPVVLAELSFALPMSTLCQEDCQGLCSSCGMDLNLQDCSCAADKIDPRWEKLKDLFPGKDSEDE